MGKQMRMDVKELDQALEILKSIPKYLDGSIKGTDTAPIADLDKSTHVTDYLKGFSANSGTASNWISGCVSDLYTYINSQVQSLSQACSGLAGQLAASMNSYTGTDKYNAGDVTRSGPVTSGNDSGKG